MLLLESPSLEVIKNEKAVPVSQLPKIWQDIADGSANVGFSSKQIYVEMAQLFQYKLEQGDVDLFNEHAECNHLKS